MLPMEPNQNPPSEREWTQEEIENFFSSQDAVTGKLPSETVEDYFENVDGKWIDMFLGKAVNNSYPPMDNQPITLESLIKSNDEFQKAFPVPVAYRNGADMSRETFEELGKRIKLVKPQGEAWLGMNVDNFIGVDIHIVESVPFGCVEECHCNILRDAMNLIESRERRGK